MTDRKSRYGLYGIFAGTKFGMSTNAKVAIKVAKKHNGVVRRMNDYPDGAGPSSWDSPTFRVMSDAFWPAEQPNPMPVPIG